MTQTGAETRAKHAVTAPMLSVRQLSHQVTDAQGQVQPILTGLSFEVAAGVTAAITGRSGSGKSTLLGLLAGLDRATAGEIWLAGQPLHRLDENQRAALRLSRVGFVFQNFELLGHLSALDNVLLPLQLAGVARRAALPRATAMLDRVGLAARLQQPARLLSGGEQQRVALARALVHQPRIVFADEPTGNLDGHTAQAVEQLLFELNREQGTTLVVVTHDVALAGRCQQQLLLQDGRL
jgi:putative ABC transport system ATP-binding protein